MFGHKGWTSATNGRRFQAVLSKHMRRATEINGMIAVRRQREVIRGSEGIVANAALTIHIKGSSKPLVDHGDLFKAITYEVVNDYQVFVGVLRTNEDAYNLAVTLHDGAAVQVTPAMRGMFFFLWKASTGDISAESLTGRAAELYARRPGGWLPLKPSTTVITIPPRPWATVAFGDPAFQQQVKNNWERAAVAAFGELAGRAGGGRSSAIGKAVKSAKKTAKKAGKVAAKGAKVAKKGLKLGRRAATKVTKFAKKTANKTKRMAKKATKSVVGKMRGKAPRRKGK